MKPVAVLPDARLFARGPVAKLLAVLNGGGEETRVVGGAVRNALMGLPLNDIDCATTALPEEVIRRASAAGFKSVPTGIAHGTVTIIIDGVAFEVTTLRRDVETHGRHATVEFGRDFSEDAARRDFTMNALMANGAGEIYDYHHGIADIAARRVRFIGDAHQRIREDYLRILRLFRFHAMYGEGPMEADALSAAVQERAGLAILSGERVRSELMKTLAAPRAAETVALMSDAGILDRVLAGVGNPIRLRFARAGQSPSQRLGLLAVETVADAQRLRAALRLSNEEFAVLEKIARIVTDLRAISYKPRTAQIKSILYREGNGYASIVFSLLASGAALNEVLRDSYHLLNWPVPALPFSGADVVALGIPAGPKVGAVLHEAERLWMSADYTQDAAQQRAILTSAVSAV